MMSEKESECPCCGEMFKSDVNSCPNNIETHKMCTECIEKSKKFFKSKAGCWYCGDREIKVVISNNRNEENSTTVREQIRQNYRSVLDDLDSIYDENGRIKWKMVFDNTVEFFVSVILVAVVLLLYSLFTYAWSGYVYLWQNYLLNNNVEYETEDDPVLIVITAMLGFMISASLLACLFSCYLCCCCCDSRRFVRFGFNDDIQRSQRSRSQVVPV